MRFALLFAALLAQSCRCSSDKPQPSTGSGSETAGGSQRPPPAERTTLDISLPRLSGKAPVKTTAPVTKAVLDKLVALEFPEFKREATPYPKNVVIRHRATTRPRVSINVFVAPCDDDKFKCRPLEVGAWRADEKQLREAALDANLRDRPETVFEIAQATLGGKPLIGIYQAGHYFGKDERNNPVASYSHAYSLHWNDGINSLRVTATFSDDPRRSIQAMQAALPRTFLEKAATAFMDTYGQAWAP